MALEFTPERRDHFLRLIGQGRTIGQACTEVGISRQAVRNWDLRGRAGHTEEAADFAGRYAEARDLAKAHQQPKLEAGFTPAKRERFLTLIEMGRTIGEACADVDISRTTVNAWEVRGREGKHPAAAEFAARFQAAREGEPTDELSQGDVIRMLERAARKGSVQAMKLLLDRPWEKKGADDDDVPQPADPFAALDAADDLAPRRASRKAG